MPERSKSCPTRGRALVSGQREALLQAAREALGGSPSVRELSWPHGESAVYLLSPGPGDRMASRSESGADSGAVLKVHARARKFRQELAAYDDWLQQLEPAERGGADGRRRTGTDGEVPRLLCAWEEERALLLTRLPGEPMWSVGTLSQHATLQAHARAGAFLRRLHELPLRDEDPLPLANAFAKRLETWSRRAHQLVDATVVVEAGRRVTEVLPELRRHRRVPCHRDFTPRNWLVDPGLPDYLGVIDFEHARPDLWLADLVRLWSGEWYGLPRLRDAFLDGYGADLSEEDVSVLDGLSALEGLATVAWAREHGDREFEARGREVLRRLGVQG